MNRRKLLQAVPHLPAARARVHPAHRVHPQVNVILRKKAAHQAVPAALAVHLHLHQIAVAAVHHHPPLAIAQAHPAPTRHLLNQATLTQVKVSTNQNQT